MTDTAASAWSLIDLILMVGLGLSVLVGAWRGLIREVFSLAGWGVAYFSAQWFGPGVAQWVPVGEAGSRANVLAGMVVVFVLVWLSWALLSWAVTQMVRASILSGPDRLMGAVFGFGRGLLVALVIVTVVSMTPVAKWAPWQQSRGVAWLQAVLDGLRPLLPDEVLQFLPEPGAQPGAMHSAPCSSFDFLDEEVKPCAASLV